jgi:nucleotide-binding universal stress UspA family protein
LFDLHHVARVTAVLTEMAANRSSDVMTFASILVNVETDSPSSDARTALAASLARRFKARLIGVAAAAVRSIPVIDPTGAAMVDAEILQAEQDRLVADLKAAGAAFLGRPDISGVDCEWRSAVYMPAEAVAREARAADLLVIGRDEEQARGSAYRSVDPGEVLLAAGRPLLVVPPATRDLHASHVVVGWKDTREARRAVADALPFLVEAETVEVVAVAGDDEADAASRQANDVVHFLDRHRKRGGAKARVAREREAAAASALILAAEQTNADLIVAGGYGHARLTEWVFGGVTRDLLRQCPVCCLLSH